MKKTKLLMPMLGITTLTTALVPLFATTSCSKQYNTVSLLEESSSNRKVSSKAVVILFKFKQDNINEPEATKVKLTNLTINDASASPVSGLLKYSADSAGNINTYFDMSLAREQYSANKVSFDLEFINKKANTSYTLSGFTINMDTESSEKTQESEWWDLYSAYVDNYITCDNNYNHAQFTNDSYVKNTVNGTTITEYNVDTSDIEYEQLSQGRASWLVPKHTDFYKKDGSKIDLDTDFSCLMYFNSIGGHIPTTNLKADIDEMLKEGMSVEYKINNDNTLSINVSISSESQTQKWSVTFNKYSYMIASSLSYTIEDKQESLTMEFLSDVKIESFISE